MKITSLALCAASLLIAAPASAAVFESDVAAPASYVGPFTYDFSSAIPRHTGGSIFSPPTMPYISAVPVGSEGDYYSVGANAVGTIFFDGFASALGGAGITSVSFLWGSIDDYNTFQFVNAAGDVLQSWTGSMINLPANGDQSSAATNRLVTFNFTDGAVGDVAGMRLLSANNAFEIDSVNITSAVPEPATWALMFMGFGLIGMAMRSTKRSTKVTFA